MKPPQIYKTATAFRRAIEDRFRNINHKDNTPLDRLRRWVAFDRFLARLFASPDSQWVLKGGYALELRFQSLARATRDIDFVLRKIKEPTKEKIHEVLVEECRKDLNDWFTFEIGAPTMDLEGPVYGGWRYPVEVLLDDRTFSQFHADIVIADILIAKPEKQRGFSLLEFAGIPPVDVFIYPREQHFAEKIHAYTVPRGTRINMRTRDLIDLVMLIEQGLPDREAVRKALELTFRHREDHAVPFRLSPPPPIWKETYQKMATECEVSKKTMDDAFNYVVEYWNALFPESNRAKT